MALDSVVEVAEQARGVLEIIELAQVRQMRPNARYVDQRRFAML